MRRPAYDSPSVPINWERIDYVSGHNEAVYVRPEAMSTVMNYYKQNPEEAKQEFGDNPYELKNILKHWVRSPKEGLQMIPTDKYRTETGQGSHQAFGYAGTGFHSGIHAHFTERQARALQE